MEKLWRDFTRYALTHTAHEAREKFKADLPSIQKYVTSGIVMKDLIRHSMTV